MDRAEAYGTLERDQGAPAERPESGIDPVLMPEHIEEHADVRLETRGLQSRFKDELDRLRSARYAIDELIARVDI